ncbi:hypothetical protein [Cognatiluteimonas telluris]|uniref:hypothetical protein n=1 Tax=Cognatiluteimonas telluris TaxID=1104775 RepID=UPI001A9C2851|nr:hypothetical protein [Lysobacter telluris]
MQAMDGIDANGVSLAHTPAVAPAARTPAIGRRTRAASRMAAMAWFATAVLGQGMFATYVVGFYGRAAAHGHPERWNEVLAVGMCRAIPSATWCWHRTCCSRWR